MRERIRLRIKGVVQGVGFRPFVYNLSRTFKVGGFVFNDARGVVVEVEGKRNNVRGFIKELAKNPPAVSYIQNIEEKPLLPLGEESFLIKKSLKGKNKFVMPSHDLGVCDDCLHEMQNSKNRRYYYPFINCTQCGPRFTITQRIPYDRKFTTMRGFKMCPKCLKEYKTPGNRRFHAQPNACFACGPSIVFTKNPKGRPKLISSIDTQQTIQKSIQHVYDGSILAVKGVGGYHICCNAKNADTVNLLRARKHRPTKPFAIMANDLGVISEICFLGKMEKQILSSNRRPIVLLRIKKRERWMNAVAPGQEYLGVMLAYAPLHYLLFLCAKEYDESALLVMTSANKKDFPLIHNERGLSEVCDTVDYFLIHNRPIHIRCDDSITRVYENREILIRKARGYTSDTFRLATDNAILGCGAEVKHTFSITGNDKVIISPYIGDLKNNQTFRFFQELLSHYQNIFSFTPKVIACDHHPNYLSTQFALSLKNVRTIPVQHHHAHLAACMLEHGLHEKTIGICFDGTGFGLDRTAWGGEFFVVDRKQFSRLGHFDHIGLLGGDTAVETPARIGLYIANSLGVSMDHNALACFEYFKKRELKILMYLIKNKEYLLSSSVGRLFDGAANLLGLSNKITYEAEAAILLEMLAMHYRGSAKPYGFRIEKNGEHYRVCWQPVFLDLLKDLTRGSDKAAIAYRFHCTLAAVVQKMAQLIHRDTGINKVVLSGGVFQNMLLLQKSVMHLEKKGFSVHYHQRLPFNDGAISAGQVVVASNNIA